MSFFNNPDHIQDSDIMGSALEITSRFLTDKELTEGDLANAEDQAIAITNVTCKADAEKNDKQLDDVIGTSQRDLETLTKIDQAVNPTSPADVGISMETIGAWGKLLKHPMHGLSRETITKNPDASKKFITYNLAVRIAICKENIASLKRVKPLSAAIVKMARENEKDDIPIPEEGKDPSTTEDANVGSVDEALKQSQEAGAAGKEEGSKEADQVEATAAKVEEGQEGENTNPTDTAEPAQPAEPVEPDATATDPTDPTDPAPAPEEDQEGTSELAGGASEPTADTDTPEPFPGDPGASGETVEEPALPEEEKKAIKITLENLRDKVNNASMSDLEAKPVLDDIHERLLIKPTSGPSLRGLGRESIMKNHRASFSQAVSNALAILSRK